MNLCGPLNTPTHVVKMAIVPDDKINCLCFCYMALSSFSSLAEKSHMLINTNEKYFCFKIKPYSFDGSLNPTHRFFPWSNLKFLW